MRIILDESDGEDVKHAAVELAKRHGGEVAALIPTDTAPRPVYVLRPVYPPKEPA